MEDTFLPFLHCSLDFLGFSHIPGLEVGGYLDSMLNSTPLVYYAALLLSFGVVAWAYFWPDGKDDPNITEDNDEKLENEVEISEELTDKSANTTGSFDISPMDVCEFVPLLSHEEDKRVAAEMAQKTRYTPLDYPSDETDSDDSINGELLKKAKDFTTEDLSKYVNSKDLHVLDDPRESPSRRGNLVSRVKKARQRAIRNAVERDMTAEDRLREQMAANQMLSRVYTVMRENKEVFGETSFDDVKSQMDLYKA